MAFLTVKAFSTIDTDVNGEARFTVSLPVDYPFLVTSTVLPYYPSATPSPPVPALSERADSPYVEVVGWTQVTLVHYIIQTNEVSGTVLVRTDLLVSDEPHEWRVYGGATTQP